MLYCLAGAAEAKKTNKKPRIFVGLGWSGVVRPRSVCQLVGAGPTLKVQTGYLAVT